MLHGSFIYFHYGVDGFADQGWGCGYRTVQSILSWLVNEELPPSIPTMQEILGVSGRAWIGVSEAVVLLDELHGAVVEVLPVSGAEMEAHLGRLSAHFERGGGPCMIGGTVDVYSKTLIGVRPADEDSGLPAELLIVDPHYDGPLAREGDMQALREGGWAAWKPLRSVLSSASHYNVAMPRPLDYALDSGRRRRRPEREAATTTGKAAAGAEQCWGIEVVAEGSGA